MPTASDRAREESLRWSDLAVRHLNAASEREVVLIHDPSHDLRRRASQWNYDLHDMSLGSLARFAGALAHTEALAWDDGSLDIATRAFDSRRHLISDRIIHWAVPWCLAVGADNDARFLLELGDEMRVAPALAGHEGLTPAGEDSYGALDQTGGIWSGWVAEGQPPEDLPAYWIELAAAHPGSARLWLDLAARSR